MKKIKFIVILSIMFLIYIFFSAYSYVSAISDNMYNSVFRLHVIANSDSDEDQNLKYIVRDNLINYMNEKTNTFTSKEDIIEYAKNHIEDLKNIAEMTVKEQGYNYPVTVEIGNFEFPTKTYGDISFPAGNYDALRVKIGNANGRNWWCVMFPPLCFVDTTTGIVSDVKLKLKILELFEQSGLITAKK